MRTDRSYLSDMFEAARDIELYIGRFEDAGAFSRSEEPKWAVLQRLTVLK